MALAFLIVIGLFASSLYIYFHQKQVPSAPAAVPSWQPLSPVPKEIVRGDTSKKQVIFTFDGGSTAQSGEAILAALEKHHVRGTFFLTGKFVNANPALVREMAIEGNEIFNHTFDHAHLPQVSDGHIAWELNALDQAVKDALASTTPNHSTRPYFRAPYGDRDARVLAAAAANGYRSVYWTVDADDWEESTGMSASETEDKILSNLAPGNIYLMHVGDNITGSILDDVFTKIEAQGYKIVSLTQGL